MKPIVFLAIAGVAALFAQVSQASISTNGLLDHFDPNAGVVINEFGVVTGWANQAAPARGATASAATVTAGSGPNGRQMLLFDSVNDTGHLSYSSAGTAAMSGGYTMFVVVDLNSGNSFPRLLRGSNDAHAIFYRPASGNIEVKVDSGGETTRPRANYTATYGPINDPAIAIVTARMTPSSQELYFNGTLVHSTSRSISSYSLQPTFQIGNSVKGRIGHVLVYDHTPTLEDLGRTGAVLAEQYGVNWDSSVLDPGPLALGIGSRYDFVNAGEPGEYVIPFENLHPEDALVLEEPVEVEGPDAAFFTVISFDNHLAPGASGAIMVSFDPTGTGGGARSYQATLTVRSNDAVFPTRKVLLEVVSHLEGLTVNPDPTMRGGLASYEGGGAPVLPGLANDPSGMIRVRGVGDSAFPGSPDSLSQKVVIPGGLPDWQMDFHFTPVDRTSWESRTGIPPRSAFTDRSFQWALLGAEAGSGSYGNDHAAKTLINLAYLPDGAGATAGVEGFYLFDGDEWVLVPQLGMIDGSTDVDSDGDSSNGVGDGSLDAADGDTVNAYRLIVTGTGFAGGAASYEIRLSGGDLETPRVAAGLTVFHSLDGDDHSPAGYVFTAGDTSISSNAEWGVATSFWVDDVHFIRGHAADPRIEIVRAADPIHAVSPATGGSTGILLRNRGISESLDVSGVTFTHAAFSISSPAFPVTIPPGGVQELVVAFDSLAIAPNSGVEAVASISSGDPLRPAASVPLKAVTVGSGLAGISATGLIDHFDPAQGVLTRSGGEVAMWSNLKDLSRSTGDATATWIVEGPNGRPMIRMNAADGGTADCFRYPSPATVASLQSGFTFVTVMRLNSPVASGNAFPRLLRGDNDTPALFLRRSNGDVEMKAEPIGSGLRPRRPFAYKYNPGDLAIVVARMTPNAGYLYFNGEPVDTRTFSTGAGYTFGSGEFQIGNSLKGDIGHVLVYDHTVTLQELGKTGSALAAAYGVAWDPSVLDPGPAGGFEAWAANPALGLPADRRGFLDDPDGDGLPNGIEHVLGTLPATLNAGFAGSLAVDGGALTFRHPLTNELAADVSYLYEWSTDLVTWHADGDISAEGASVQFAAATVEDREAPENDEIEVVATLTHGAVSKLFVRIRAVRD